MHCTFICNCTMFRVYVVYCVQFLSSTAQNMHVKFDTMRNIREWNTLIH